MGRILGFDTRLHDYAVNLKYSLFIQKQSPFEKILIYVGLYIGLYCIVLMTLSNKNNEVFASVHSSQNKINAEITQNI